MSFVMKQIVKKISQPSTASLILLNCSISAILKVTPPWGIILLFLERFYCSCFEYWSFSNKVFLKIKSPQKKLKLKKKEKKN